MTAVFQNANFIFDGKFIPYHKIQPQNPRLKYTLYVSNFGNLTFLLSISAIFAHFEISIFDCHTYLQGGEYPSMHWGRTPLPRADTPPPKQTPLCPVHAGIHPPCPVYAGIHPPPPAATAADGTHPTGMHSCTSSQRTLRRKYSREQVFSVLATCK